jgi:hypothetical protein
MDALQPSVNHVARGALPDSSLSADSSLDISSGVAACESLANGLLADDDNRVLRKRLVSGRLSARNFYHQLQRQIFRWLVLLIAEERTDAMGDNLLHVPGTSASVRARYGAGHSLSRLRDLAAAAPPDDRNKGRALYASLQDTLCRLRDGDPTLGIPAMRTFLFSVDAAPDFEATSLPDADLLRAVRQICFAQDSRGSGSSGSGTAVPQAVDFGRLPAQQLGSLHESFLQLRPVLRNHATRFSLVLAATHERKATGSYYTPDTLIDCLLESSLEPVLRRVLRDAWPGQAEEALLRVRVCDPACGSGHFLLAAAGRMARVLSEARCQGSVPGRHVVQRAKQEVIDRCLYGVDLNPLAVELCKVSLWMEAAQPGRALGSLAHRIQCGNSLLGATPAHLEAGIPNEAFAATSEDDRRLCAELRTRNRRERGESQDKASSGRRTRSAAGDPALNALSATDAKTVADAWCAAFTWKKDASATGRLCPTSGDLRAYRSNPSSIAPQVREELERQQQEHQFFHWHLAFPDVFQGRPADPSVADPSKVDSPKVDSPKADSSKADSSKAGSPKAGSRGAQQLGDEVDGWSGGFDVILGNPPYGAESQKADRKLCKFLYPSAAATCNTAADFIALARERLKPCGQLALVVPKSLTYSHSWRSIRQLLLPDLTTVVDASKAWPEVRLEQVLFSAEYSTPQASIALGQIAGRQTRWNRKVARDMLNRLDIFPTSLVDEDVELLAELYGEGTVTISSAFATRRGTNVQRFRRADGDLPLLAGRDIGSFLIRRPSTFARAAEVPVDKLRFAEAGQVVFQNIVAHLTMPAAHISLTGAILQRRVACLDTVNLLSPRFGEPHAVTLSPHGLCGLLMSDLINWFVHVGVYNRAIRTMHFDGYFLDKIPLPPTASFSSLHEAAQGVEAEPRHGGAWARLNEVVFDAFCVPRRLATYVSSARKPRVESLALKGRPGPP